MASLRAAVVHGLLGAGLAGAAALIAVALDRRSRAAPPPAAVGSAFDQMNEGFHGAYEGARQRTEHDAPVLVVLTDSLILCRKGRRDETQVTPPIFHVIKSVAHGPVGIFATLRHLKGEGLDSAARARLTALRRSLHDALPQVDGAAAEAEARARLHAVVAMSLAFVDRTLETGRAPRAELDAFASEAGPLLLGCTDDATRVQLDALNERVAATLKQLSDEERRGLRVVVTGSHQARERSLAMQYFAALLHESEGAEDRLTYGEGVTGVDDALALVGTQRFDREIAGAFFGDPKRLQRDVLGDAVQRRLSGFALPREPRRGG